MGALVKPPAGPGAFEKRNMVQTHSAAASPHPWPGGHCAPCQKQARFTPSLSMAAYFLRAGFSIQKTWESEIGMFAFKDSKLFSPHPPGPHVPPTSQHPESSPLSALPGQGEQGGSAETAEHQEDQRAKRVYCPTYSLPNTCLASQPRLNSGSLLLAPF